MIKNGDTIQVEYTGTLDDGTEFDSSKKHGHPLEFQVGAKQVIRGFDEAVVGMKKGEEKKIRLEPKDAYGDPNPLLVQKVPKDKLPKEADVGMTLAMSLPNGMQVPVKIAAMDDATATLDMNHPMAGKTLTFKIKVVKIN